MTGYAEVCEGALIAYPYTFSNLQADNPYTNFGNIIDVAYWFPLTQKAQETGNTLQPVESLPLPVYDPAEQFCRQEAQPSFIDGRWALGWVVTNKTPEQKQQELDAWRANASCTPFQGRMALSDAALLEQAQALVEAGDEKTRIAWEYALVWERLSPMIVTLAGAMSLTDAQVDDLFKAAQQITA